MNKKRSTPAEVGHAMSRLVVHLAGGAQLESVAKTGVTHTQFLVLMALRSHGRCTMGALAKSLHASLPTTTGVVDRLLQNGLLRRQAVPEDRRQVVVELTAKGEACVEVHRSVIRDRWKEAFGAFTSAELESFHHLISILRDRLQVEKRP